MRSTWISQRQPVLIVHGRDDIEGAPFTSVQAARYAFAADGRKNFEFIFYDNIGHDLLTKKVFLDVDRWLHRSLMNSPRQT